MEIRRLDPLDYDAFLELFRANYQLYFDNRPDYFVRKSDDELMPRETFMGITLMHLGTLMLGAFDENDKLVGFANASIDVEETPVLRRRCVCLDGLYVEPESRRKGIATKLVDAVKEWASMKGAVRMYLEEYPCAEAAVEFYRAYGMGIRSVEFELDI